MQINIALLKREHAAILAAIDHLTALTAKPFDEAAPDLAKARMTLAKLVSANMASETAEIHAPLQARGLTDAVPAYAAIATRTRDLRLIFSAHIGTWQVDVIARDWSGYGQSLRAINADLAAILAWEERDLFPVAQAVLAAADAPAPALRVAGMGADVRRQPAARLPLPPSNR